jgi:hypothetical protein
MTASDDKTGLYALLITTLLAGGGIFWRSASLRSTIFRTWQDRRNQIHAGLSQGAIDSVVQLQDEATDLLSAGKFAADPDPLVKPVNNFRKAVRVRQRFARRINLLLKTGPAMTAASAVYLVGWLFAAVYFLGWTHHRWVRDVGWVVGSVGVTGVVVLGIAYVYLTHRLAFAEELADTLTRPPEDPLLELGATPDAFESEDGADEDPGDV